MKYLSYFRPSNYTLGHDEARRTQTPLAARTGLSARGFGSLVECCRSSSETTGGRGDTHKVGGWSLRLSERDRVRESTGRRRQAGRSFSKGRPVSSRVAQRVQQPWRWHDAAL